MHLDLKPLQEEVLDACHIALLLNHYQKDYKAQSNSSIKKYFIGVQNDVLQICINCIKKLSHISKIFGLKVELESNPKEHKPILERRIKKRETGKKTISNPCSSGSNINSILLYSVTTHKYGWF